MFYEYADRLIREFKIDNILDNIRTKAGQKHS